jgi:WS/DGAT/MGAT family acyltransferase
MQDGLFLLAETRETPMHVGGLQVFQIPPKAPSDFVARLYEELRRYPVSVAPLNYQLAAGIAGRVMPSWEVATEVDLDHHVRHSALPHPGGERELGTLISRLHSNPMDLARPLWEYHLVEGLAGDRFAVYSKLHHAMFDGAATMRLVNLGNERDASYGPPFWADASRQPSEPVAPPNSLLERIPATIANEVRSLPSLARGLATTAQAALRVGAKPNLASIIEAPRTIFNVRVGVQRRVATYEVGLDRIKAIGKAAGGTINDVVLAVCSAALRRYLAERDALPKRTLIATVPMALQPQEGAAAGNAVSALTARLGTDITDVRKRFETIVLSSAAGKAQLKDMTQTAAMHFATVMSVPVLIQTLVPGLERVLPPQSNLIISNVPGSRERLYFHGAEMLAHYPVSQVGHGMALNITVISYAGGLYFGFVACPDAMPSVQRLAVHMEPAMAELEATFLGSEQRRGSGMSEGARKKSAGARPRTATKQAVRMKRTAAKLPGRTRRSAVTKSARTKRAAAKQPAPARRATAKNPAGTGRATSRRRRAR